MSEVVKVQAETGEEINLTPNFTNLVYMFTRDAKLHAGILERSSDGDVINTFRNFLVSLNIACMSVHDNETLVYLRQEIDGMTKRLVKIDDERQRCPAE
jgi:hypothetical protein